MTYQNLWDTEKSLIKGKFLTMSAYIKKSDKYQISNLMHFTCLGKQKHISKVSRHIEIIKTRTEMEWNGNKKYKELVKQKVGVGEDVGKKEPLYTAGGNAS
jgi:hypothetical protein